MNPDKSKLVEADLTELVIGIFFAVYNEMGAGFLESVYENAFAIALSDAGLVVQKQAPLVVRFRKQIVGEFKVDLLVSGKLIIELKAISQLTTAHEVQLVNYLKASGLHVGLLLNFGSRPQFKRRVFSQPKVDPRSSDLICVQSHV